MDRTAWVDEILEGLRSGFEVPKLTLTEDDSRAFERLERGTILMVECARNSRGNKAVQQEIIDSVLLAKVPEKRTATSFSNPRGKPIG